MFQVNTYLFTILFVFFVSPSFLKKLYIHVLFNYSFVPFPHLFIQSLLVSFLFSIVTFSFFFPLVFLSAIAPTPPFFRYPVLFFYPFNRSIHPSSYLPVFDPFIVSFSMPWSYFQTALSPMFSIDLTVSFFQSIYLGLFLPSKQHQSFLFIQTTTQLPPHRTFTCYLIKKTCIYFQLLLHKLPLLLVPLPTNT